MVAQSTRRGRQGQSLQSQMGEMAARPQELIQDYPFSSALLVFGIGLGVGVVLSQAFLESDSRMWSSETASERWGRKIYDYMSHMVPESVSRRMS